MGSAQKRHRPDRPAAREQSLEENDVWPANVQIERELIGCLLLAGCEYALESLQPRDFHDSFCRLLFEEVRQARADGVPVNSEGALLQWLKQRGAYSKASKKFPDDTAWNLGKMMQQGVVANVKYYCGVLREQRRKRAAKRIAHDALRDAVNDEVTADQWRTSLAGHLDNFEKVRAL